MSDDRLILTKIHLEKFKQRLLALQSDFKAAKSEGDRLDNASFYWRERNNTQDDEFNQRLRELETKYRRDIDEITKQYSQAQEVMRKKEEERDTLLNILNQSNICDRLDKDLRGIDWPALKRVASRRQSSDKLEDQQKKALILAELILRARNNIEELGHALTDIKEIKLRFKSKLDQFIKSVNDTEELYMDQSQRFGKMQNDSERLRLLIKQCAITNEPMSDFVTKNVRAKCHSFLESDSIEDLKDGLVKFRDRQAKMITLLKHQENRLVRDCNLLKVAADQTNDQTKEYVRMKHNGNAPLEYNLNLTIPNFHEKLIQGLDNSVN